MKRHNDHLGAVAEHAPITLLGDQVLIRLIHPERLHHNLWIPETAKRTAGELWRGEVIACGPGARTPKKGILIPCQVSPGDVVQFFWRAAKVNVTAWPDKEHRIISEEDIQLVYESEPA